MSSLDNRTHSWRMMKEPLASSRLRSALKSLSKLSMNCLKCGEVDVFEGGMFEVPVVEVGMGTLLEPSPGRQVLEEEISANTSRSSTTT